MSHCAVSSSEYERAIKWLNCRKVRLEGNLFKHIYTHRLHHFFPRNARSGEERISLPKPCYVWDLRSFHMADSNGPQQHEDKGDEKPKRRQTAFLGEHVNQVTDCGVGPRVPGCVLFIQNPTRTYLDL